MPQQPTMNSLHLSAALTDMSVAYWQEPNHFVCGKVFPVVPVTKQADRYFTLDEKDWLRTDANYRAPGAPAPLSGWNTSNATYFCDRVSIGKAISDPERENADAAVANLEADTVRWINQQLLIKEEVDWAATFMTTSVWTGASSTTDMTGSSTAPASTATNFLQWNDVASTPIEDIHGEQMIILERTGQLANTLVIGAEVWNDLRDHPDVLDRIKYTERGVVTKDLLASLLDVERVEVTFATRNSNREGSTSASMDFVVGSGKSALLCYTPARPGLNTPAAGYTFVWTGRTGAPVSGLGATIKRWRNEEKESDIIEGERWRDFKVIGANLGAHFASAVA